MTDNLRVAELLLKLAGVAARLDDRLENLETQFAAHRQEHMRGAFKRQGRPSEPTFTDVANGCL
jgi:hypothetical protein